MGHEAAREPGAMKMAAPAAAAPAAPAPAPEAAQVEAIDCPVSGGKVEITAETPRSTYNGKTYYFCCAGCKESFDKNPQGYVK
jgi:Cu+-exporting ATPase